MDEEKYSKRDLVTEKWREYDDLEGHVYRIENPAMLIIRIGSDSHRVVDTNNIVHYIPAKFVKGGIIRWESKDGFQPVAF